MNDNLIAANPLDRVKLNRLLPKEAKRVDYEVDPFSAAEIKAIIANAKPQERNMFLFAFTTGVRPTAHTALKWSSVDLVENTVRVERARVVRITRDETKTDSGRRTIDLRRGALQALLDQRQYTLLEGDLVFHDPFHNADWQDSSRVSTKWNSVLKKAGVRHRVLYQTRHTFASTLLSSGVNLLYVAKQMGHKDTTMVHLRKNGSNWMTTRCPTFSSESSKRR